MGKQQGCWTHEIYTYNVLASEPVSLTWKLGCPSDSVQCDCVVRVSLLFVSGLRDHLCDL